MCVACIWMESVAVLEGFVVSLLCKLLKHLSPTNPCASEASEECRVPANVSTHEPMTPPKQKLVNKLWPLKLLLRMNPKLNPTKPRAGCDVNTFFARSFSDMHFQKFDGP